jgi:DNA repair protein RadC
VIQAPEDVANLVMNEMKYLEREHFRAIFLNTKNYVIGIDTISIGFLDSSLIHPREIFRNAIRHCAADIILLHNHPSGNPTPSKEDIEVTARLVESGNLLGIQILDHIIIGDGKFVSLKSKGLI